ncbi:MAG: phosphoribosylanthranilate isomerase [Ostreibacterium sp.]
MSYPLKRTRIKICGFTRQTDARVAIDLGVDALGFVFYEKSKRAVKPENLNWLRTLPSFVQLTGLFVNPENTWVKQVTKLLPLDLLQFHGNESPEFCDQFAQRYIKAIPMQNMDKTQAINYLQQYPNATGVLLDNYGAGHIGGSGTVFDWSKIPTELSAPLIMAGGLQEDNVAEIIRHYSPYAVDVSSGVESAIGIKSTEKMTAFIQAVNRADQQI